MLAYLFVLIAVAVRFLPHPWTFTPVGAALLYFGARAPRKQIWFPLALMIASDVVLTRSTYGYSVPLDHLLSWMWYAGVLWLGGSFLRRNAGRWRIAGASVGAALAFFVVSNFGVWAVWNMYPKTAGGLLACYVAAIPYARNFIADPLFSAVFFGIGALVASRNEAVKAPALDAVKEA